MPYLDPLATRGESAAFAVSLFGAMMTHESSSLIGPLFGWRTAMKAVGILSWPAVERRSDRYGMIGLSSANYHGTATSSVELNLHELAKWTGFKVHIIARVIEARESGHVGDLFRQIFPSIPKVGEVVDLGSGFLIVGGQQEDMRVFGLRPEDGRKTDWFDPKKLYRLHDQTVELEFQLES